MIKKQLNRGFTLIEMALVLTIIGIIIAGASKFGAASIEIAKLKATKTQMATIKDALQLYYETNGRLPCPASGALLTTNAAFGIEKYNAGSCDPSSGLLAKTSGRDMYIGVVPTRSLNIPDSYMVDGWGNRISYAVIKSCVSAWVTTSPDYCGSTELLSVIDNSGNSLTVKSDGTPLTTVSYVVISHGKNGIGSWNQAGNRVTSPCPTGNLSTYEMDNAGLTSGCATGTTDYIFRDNATNDGTVAANYFDDIVAWQTDNRMYYIKSCKASGTSC